MARIVGTPRSNKGLKMGSRIVFLLSTRLRHFNDAVPAHKLEGRVAGKQLEIRGGIKGRGGGERRA